jgi:hypothetical protein
MAHFTVIKANQLESFLALEHNDESITEIARFQEAVPESKQKQIVNALNRQDKAVDEGTVSVTIDFAIGDVRRFLEEHKGVDTSHVSDAQMEEFIRHIATNESSKDRIYEELSYWFKEKFV